MWQLRMQEAHPNKPWVVYEPNVPEMAHLGRGSWNVEVFYGGKCFCVVKLWACGSCALSEFRNLNPAVMPDEDSFMDWLKTQPFNEIDGWEHQIFIFLPNPNISKYYPNFAAFMLKHCTVISSFPNHAHDGHLLSLYQLDLTKYVPAPHPTVS